MSELSSRERATARFREATEAIERVFDAVDRLAELRCRAVALASIDVDDDPLGSCVELLDVAGDLGAGLDQLRAAAETASAFTSKRQLAADLGTRQALLFPPSSTSTTSMSRSAPAAGDVAAAGSGADA